MKTPLLLLAAISLLLVGCKTGPTPQQMATAATFAAYTGASIDLLSHTNHCVNYKAVTLKLDQLDAAGDYDPAHFVGALQGLPIKQLSDPRATLIIGETFLLWDIFSGQIVGTNQTQFVQPVLRGTDTGLKAALMGSKCQ
jgi:hypothetical protein